LERNERVSGLCIAVKFAKRFANASLVIQQSPLPKSAAT